MDRYLKYYLIVFISILLSFSIGSFVHASILINEFMPNSVDTDYEWVELYNDNILSVNLSNFNISEERAARNFTIGDVIIGANAFIVLARNATIFNQTYRQIVTDVVEYGPLVPSLNLNDGGDSIYLYDSLGNVIDSILDYANPGENISIGRYPDGNPMTFTLLTQTPGTKNDNYPPTLNMWVNPSRNGTYLSGLVNIIVNISDDTTQVDSATINFGSVNYSMSKNNDLWSFLWDTSLSMQNSYNITIFFNDSYGKDSYDTLFNIILNNDIANNSIGMLNAAPNITYVNLTSTDDLNRRNSTLEVSWSYIDEDGDAITTGETLWYINGSESVQFRNLTRINAVNLKKYQTWAVSVRIFDGKNWSRFYNSTKLTISNSAPTHSSPVISSDDYKSRRNGTLTCSNQSTSDLDGDSVVNSIKWYKNDVLIVSAIGSKVLKPGNHSKNDYILCEITPNDGLLNGISLNSTEFLISNAAPLLATMIQSKAWNQDTSTEIGLSNHFIDSDGDYMTYTSTTVPNITVSIDNSRGTATLIPDKSFSGTRYMIFFASDGESSSSSNNISLIINSVSNPIVESGENGYVDLIDKKPATETESDELESNISITGRITGSESHKKNIIYTSAVLVLIIFAFGSYFVIKKVLTKRIK